MGESQGPDRAGMWLTSVGASRSRPVFPLLYCLLACLLAVLCIEEDLLLQSHYLLHPFNPYHPFQVSKYEIYVEDYYIYTCIYIYIQWLILSVAGVGRFALAELSWCLLYGLLHVYCSARLPRAQLLSVTRPSTVWHLPPTTMDILQLKVEIQTMML